MSYEAQFREALQAVGADESKWPLSTPYALGCKFGNGIKLIVFNDGHVCFEDLVAWRYALREADDNLVEAVRFAENLRRALAGEPSLEVERLQKALDQALFFAEIRPDNYDDDTLYARSTFDQNPMLFRDSFPELAAELKRRVSEVQG